MAWLSDLIEKGLKLDSVTDYRCPGRDGPVVQAQACTNVHMLKEEHNSCARLAKRAAKSRGESQLRTVQQEH